MHGISRLSLTAGVAALLAAPAGAETIRLSIGGGHPVTAGWVATIKDHFQTEVARRVKETTSDDIEWTEGYGGSVCKLDECLETVEAGLLDVAMIGVAFEPSKLQAHNFTYFVPFGSPDPVVAAEATRKVYDEVPELSAILRDEFSQVFLGASVVGNYGLTTNFEWTKVDDLAGHKVAAAGPNLPWLDGTGISPVPSNLNDAYTALQTGVYDGWIMYADGVLGFRLFEVSKTFADLSFGSVSFPILTMNADRFDELSPEVQQIFTEVGRDWGMVNAEAMKAAQTAALETMKTSGVNFVPVDEAMKADFASRMPNLPKERFEEIEAAGGPAEAIYAYIAALKELVHVFPRDWEAEK